MWALGAHPTLLLLAPCSPEAPTLWPGFCVDLGFRDPRTECKWAGLHAACISSGKRLTSCIQGLSREGPGPIKSHSASCCLHLSTRAVDGCLECVMATQSPSPCPRTVLPLQRMTAGPGSPIPPVCKPPGASPCHLSPTLQLPLQSPSSSLLLAHSLLMLLLQPLNWTLPHLFGPVCLHRATPRCS